VLPGVLAISFLHQYGGIPRHTGIGKHYWMLAVTGGAVIAGLATWWWHRRRARNEAARTAAASVKD
jgi:membrane-associated protein